MKLLAFFLAALLLLSVGLNSISATTENDVPLPVSVIDDSLTENGEKFTFQTEVSKVMDIIINSLYSQREIFLRELISNASDALDKIRFISLTESSVLDAAPDLNITIIADKVKGTLVIRDTGIGMSKEGLVAHLGTIAKSGTSEFLKKIEKDKKDIGMIGQFGVGFYSVYLVADRVNVITKTYNDSQYIWSSTAQNDFVIKKDPRGNTLGRGTQLEIHLKKDALKYLEESTLERLVHTYSEFINYPIYLYITKTETEEVPVEEEEKEEGKEEDAKVEDAEEEKKPKTKKVEKKTFEFKRVNENKPIWTRAPQDITEKEYQDFYKTFTKESSNPMKYLHFKAEGAEVDFRSILFIPEKAPANFLNSDETLKNIKLFVRRVFITDELLDLLPRYLAFIKGLVDSDDLPLNVSRQTLQKSKLLKVIKKKLVSKAIELIESLSKEKEDYDKFWKEYSVAVKMGVLTDSDNKKKLLKLLRFKTSSSGENLIPLSEYISRMKKNQTGIYYMLGNNIDEIEKSPFVEKLLGRGYEVVYMEDPIDGYLMQGLYEFESKKFQDVTKDGLKFGDEDEDEKKEHEKAEADFKPLADWLVKVLGSKIEKVTISNRLTESPCALVAASFGYNGHMQKLMQAQAYASKNDPLKQFYMSQKSILEINPKHPVIQSMLDRVNNEKVDATIEEMAHILFDSAALRSNYDLNDKNSYTKRIENLIRTNLGVDLEAQAEVKLKPAQAADPSEKEEPKEEHDHSHDHEGHDHSDDHEHEGHDHSHEHEEL